MTRHVLKLMLLILIIIYITSIFSSTSFAARLLSSSHPGEKMWETDVTISTLMGSEDCESKDEACMKRRMIAEAHLDYIYTQSQNP